MEREIIKLSDPDAFALLVDYGITEFTENYPIEDYPEYSEYFNEEGEYLENNPFWDDFEYHSTETEYTDLEKGYEDYNVYLRRISDNKYFEGRSSYSPYNGYELGNKLTEVFPREITTLIFE